MQGLQTTARFIVFSLGQSWRLSAAHLEGTAPRTPALPPLQDDRAPGASPPESQELGRHCEDLAARVTGVTSIGPRLHPRWRRENPAQISMGGSPCIVRMDGLVLMLETRICWKLPFHLVVTRPLPNHQPPPLSPT